MSTRDLRDVIKNMESWEAAMLSIEADCVTIENTLDYEEEIDAIKHAVRQCVESIKKSAEKVYQEI